MKKQEIIEKIREIYENGKVKREDSSDMSLVSAHHYVMSELNKLTQLTDSKNKR